MAVKQPSDRVLREYQALCVELRTQLTAKTAECAEAIRRGDELMDKLLAFAGQNGLTVAGRAVQARERAAETQFLRNLDEDDFSEVAFNHPESRFTRAEEAMIDPLAAEPGESHDRH